jgi:NAD(P)H-dependent FMN reductase
MEASLPAAGQYHQATTKRWAAKVSEADGYIFVTPEYNHGYPASLKNAIDHIYAECQKKPVAFIGYGSLGATRSIEQLVQITAQIGMVPLPMISLNIIDLRTALDENGAVKATNLRGSVERLMTQLVEWAVVLKHFRQTKKR